MEDLVIPVPQQPISDEQAPWLRINAAQIRQLARYVEGEPEDSALTLQIRGQGYFNALWRDHRGGDHTEYIFPHPAPGE